jgi:lipopolysaccharide transport system permease protein
MNQSTAGTAGQDWWLGTSRIGVWWPLAWFDISLRYRRSMLGPWWITISTGLMLMGMGPLYASLFNLPISSFFPNLAIGFIFWGFIGGTINESCTVFTSAAGYLKHSDSPISLFAWRMLARNVIQLAHQSVLYAPVAVLSGITIGPSLLLFIPGFAILIVNLHAIEISLGIICARFRDVPQVVASLLQFLMFLTPVVWMPESLPEHAKFVLNNPFAHLLALVREPLLGKVCGPEVWGAAIAWTVVNVLIAMAIFKWKRRQVVYWV